jgi:pimeloyl-ACP methyl ester carboxylesterase
MPKKRDTENLVQFCAPGASVREEMIPVSETVQLRLVTFDPAEKKNNPDVVFVSGWISLIDGWAEVLKELTREFRVYYIETREKISSRVEPETRFSVFHIGNDIVTLIRVLDLKKKQYLILASSLGATAILETCRFLKSAPCSLVLISPNAVFRVPKIWQIIVKLFYKTLFVWASPLIKWYLRTFRMNVKSDPAQYKKYCRTLDNADPWKSKKAVMSLWNYQVWDKLEGIKIPTLIIGASKDKLHEPENTQRMVNLIPRVEYLDMETNARNHSKEMVREMRNYLARLN